MVKIKPHIAIHRFIRPIQCLTLANQQNWQRETSERDKIRGKCDNVIEFNTHGQEEQVVLLEVKIISARIVYAGWMHNLWLVFALIYSYKSFRFSKLSIFHSSLLYELLNKYQACLYSFECISCSVSKFENEI